MRNERRMQIPPEVAEAKTEDVKEPDAPGGPTVAEETREPEHESALQEVLVHLRAQTGHDFSHYKRATVLRRIARRLQVNSLETVPDYLNFLRRHSAEAHALLRDLLIGVTNFFRDQEAFAGLEANIPQLFAGKGKDDQIRVWVAGCATGEEAYSLAILLCEYAERLETPPAVQIFASDIDEEALHEARDGLYPPTIEADVSPERLERFFGRDQGRYRVNKTLREKVLFAAHNLLSDAPFSRLDLVSCRNLLIYLTPKAQAQVFDIFHFALRAGALMFIGGAETGEQGQALFSAVDSKNRIYTRRSVPRPSWKIPALPLRARPSAGMGSVAPRARVVPAFLPLKTGTAAGRPEESASTRQERRAALFGELHLELLEQYGPPSVVVNEAHDIVHLSEHAGRYLQFVAGEPSANLLHVIHPSLRIELRTGLFRAAQANEDVIAPGQTVEIDGAQEVINLHILPMRQTAPGTGFFLVLFERSREPVAAPPSDARHEAVRRDLDDEVRSLRGQLSATIEQYEASNEELKASNEELQAVNEEMHSATEELETSKEELQSVNEELSTVNHQLKTSVEELSRTNADLSNLMASTDIATLFLTRELHIQRFTPSAQKIFNLLRTDIGRPLSDITHNLHYAGLHEDAVTVLEGRSVIEREVAMSDDSWFLLRMAPYRTADDRIAGVVATFVDITERRRMENQLRESEERLRLALEIETVGVIFFSPEGRISDSNEAFLRMSGYSRADLSKGLVQWDGITPPEWRERSAAALREFNRTGKMGIFEKQYIRKDGERWWGLASATRLSEELGVKYVVDITETKQAEQALRESEERFRQFAENSKDVFWIAEAPEGRIEYVNPAYEKIWGDAREQKNFTADHWLDHIHPDDRAKVETILPRILTGEDCVTEYRIVRSNDGELRWIRNTGFPINDENGRTVRAAGLAQDITQEKQRIDALAASEERFRLLVDGARDYAMFLLGPDNVVSFWSLGAERLFGWKQEEAIGQKGDLIFTAEDRAKGAVEKELAITLKEGRSPDRRYHLRKDGSVFWADGVMMRINDERGELRGFAKVARDATEQKMSDDKLQRIHEELEQRVLARTQDVMATNKELERTMAQRQQLEKELLEISEREKRRIGEDLHDIICQELTATALFLRSSANNVVRESPDAAATLEESAQIVNRNVGLARDLARGLQPTDDLKGPGLKEALRAMAEQACETSDIKCHFKAARGVRVADDTIALHLYRVAQEAVNNAIKHSGAKNVLITLDKNTENVCVSVQDDGKGFSPRRRSKGLGLHLMRYRANALGGELKIQRRRTGGMDITCVIPVKW
ncbi:MAG TPA: PAS domain S-box protein [Chthoniobacterales bacterium]|nr:PAS domain S-box protein [Chthoniobacterales bacterium]